MGLARRQPSSATTFFEAATKLCSPVSLSLGEWPARSRLYRSTTLLSSRSRKHAGGSIIEDRQGEPTESEGDIVPEEEDDNEIREGSIQLDEVDESDAVFESDDEDLQSVLQHATDMTAFIDHGNLPWAMVTLEATQKVLSAPSQQHLQLYLFRAVAKGTRLDIRLDKPEDPYGSPSMEDTEQFLRALTSELEAAIGPEETDNIDIEVSSPGVERAVRIPGELQRFQEIPMTVEYELDNDRLDTRVLELMECNTETGSSLWKLADVKRNRAGKGRPKLSNKQAQQRFDIPIRNLRKVRLFLDM
ncbi:hypothetical protein WJX84_006745 [Apatococcus fuscideae]